MSNRFEELAQKHIQKLCSRHLEYMGDLKGRKIAFDYRYEHIRTTAGIAGELAQKMNVEPELARIAAWLHDIAKCWDPILSHEENKARSKDHGPRGGEEAAQFLQSIGYPQEKIQLIKQAITVHIRFIKDYTLDQPLDALLWDADKLSKLSPAGIMHWLGYALAGDEPMDMVQYFSDLDFELYQGIRDSLNTQIARDWADEELIAIKKLQQQVLASFKGKCY